MQNWSGVSLIFALAVALVGCEEPDRTAPYRFTADSFRLVANEPALVPYVAGRLGEGQTLEVRASDGRAATTRSQGFHGIFADPAQPVVEMPGGAAGTSVVVEFVVDDVVQGRALVEFVDEGPAGFALIAPPEIVRAHGALCLSGPHSSYARRDVNGAPIDAMFPPGLMLEYGSRPHPLYAYDTGFDQVIYLVEHESELMRASEPFVSSADRSWDLEVIQPRVPEDISHLELIFGTESGTERAFLAARTTLGCSLSLHAPVEVNGVEGRYPTVSPGDHVRAEWYGFLVEAIVPE